MGRTLRPALLAGWGVFLALIIAGLLRTPEGLAGAPETTSAAWWRLARLTGSTLSMAALAALAGSLWALPVSLAAGLVESPRGRVLLTSLATVPLFIAPPVLAVVTVRLLGAQGYITNLIYDAHDVLIVPDPVAGVEGRVAPAFTMPGIALTIAAGFFPIAFLAQLALLRRLDTASIEAARLEGPDRSILSRLIVPSIFGGIATGAAAVFLIAATEFGIPESLRSQATLVTEVYIQFGVFYNGAAAFRVAVALAAVALLLLGAFFLLAERLFATEAPLEAGEYPEGRAVLPSARGWLRFLGWAAAAIPTGAIIGVLVYTMERGAGGGDRLGVLRETWLLTKDEFFFSLMVSALGAGVCLAVGVALGWMLAGLRRPLWARMFLLFGFILPSPIIAIGLKGLLNWAPGSLPLGLDDFLFRVEDSLAPMAMAYAVRFAPLVALLCEAALRRVPRELREAQLLESSSLLAAIRSWALPALLPAMGAGFLASFALVAGESGATILLIPPGTTTLSVRLLTLMHFAPNHQVSALSLLIVLPVLIVLPAIFVLTRQILKR